MLDQAESGAKLTKKQKEVLYSRKEKQLMNKNPYCVLGVNENATDEEVKKAYRELAKKYHDKIYHIHWKDLGEEWIPERGKRFGC